MSGRVTPKGHGPGPDDELPPLRERSPVVWWVAVLAVVGMVAGTVGGGLMVLLA